MKRTPSPRRSLLWAAIAGTLYSGTAVAAPLFRITVIPSLPLGELCSPNAINDLGHVVGTCAQHTFFWTPEGGAIEIKVPTGYLGARALNNHDVMAAEHTKPDVTRDGVLWDPVNGLRVFTPDGDFPEIGEVNGINDAGKVVGAGWVPRPPHTPRHAFTWTEETGVVDPLPDVAGETQLRDINALGQMVGWGWGNNLEGGSRAVILEADGRVTRLEAPFCSTNGAQAYGLNDLGQVAGSCYNTPNSLHAVVWAGPRHGRDIDGRAEGKGISQAFEVNNAGQVVGFWSGGGHSGHAWETSFYWDPETKMTSIHRLLDPTDPLAAVTKLGTVATINQAGQIATAGTVNGEWQLLLLTPVVNSSTASP
ncbi:MAG TPA: hypothetical protein VFY73_09855 [Ideonella sp.]|uniref:hypothetical protein n=1 Tax=Ideonella sp. TaxID=1929293 RepID=UPI002E32E8B5|nr:hypothetical protein [Ideonella sp.]HEX5684328.1 hypothetical protein [Ideonella sp.]